MNARPAIDWNDVRQRMLKVETALSRASAPESATVLETLDERARQLAARQVPERGAKAQQKCLIFRAGSARFAIELGCVIEVGNLKRCTPLPGASSEICGVIFQRGKVRSVIDLNRLLGDSQPQDSSFDYFMHIGVKDAGAIIRATEVEGIADLSESVSGAEHIPSTTLPSDAILGLMRDGATILRAESILARINKTSRSCGGHSSAPTASQEKTS